MTISRFLDELGRSVCRKNYGLAEDVECDGEYFRAQPEPTYLGKENYYKGVVGYAMYWLESDHALKLRIKNNLTNQT